MKSVQVFLKLFYAKKLPRFLIILINESKDNCTCLLTVILKRPDFVKKKVIKEKKNYKTKQIT